jgi:hypothetical protein
LKEKVKATPKELVRRGLDNGTERLRVQLRDAAQRGQADDYGGDCIEDTAVGGVRRAERGIEFLVKRKKADQNRIREENSLSAIDSPVPQESTAEYFSPYEPTQRERPNTVSSTQPWRKQISSEREPSAPAVHGSEYFENSVRQSKKSTSKSVSPTKGIPERAAQRTIKTAEQSPRKAIKTSQITAKTATKTAQTAGRATNSTIKAVGSGAAVKAAVSSVKAAIVNTKSSVMAIAADGMAAVAVVLVVCMMGLLLAAPFSILSSNDGNDLSDQQNAILDELLTAGNQALWNDLLYSSNGQIVMVAMFQLGNVGGQPYWSWYGFNSRVEWCACFVSWCANQCGYIDGGIIPKFASCTVGANWFKERGLWQDNSYEPRPGDLIFFDWDNKGSSGPQDDVPDHVGIVERVEDGVIYTIEGNSGDSCRQRSYPVGYYEIWGFATPIYN